MTALLTDNLPLLAGAPNGIKKLRELILELAVRGKLVPQDPNDEPASELLKRIAEEKARLVAEGKIKKQRPLVEVDEQAQPFELPVDWVWTRLGEITNFGTTTKKDEIPDDAWVLDLEDIEKDTSRLLQKTRFYERNSLSDKNSFTKGDVLYGKLRPYLNKVLVAEDDGFCTTEILPFRCHGPFVAHYFMIALKSPYFLSYVNAKSYGMKMPRLGTEDGRQAFFPLPPLAEQHRIVAKVDELMALCDRLEAQQADADSAHTQLVQALLDSLTQASDADDFAQSWQRLAKHFHTLFTTESSIDALKQTLLQLAVMGKLVPQSKEAIQQEPLPTGWSTKTMTEFCTVQGGIQKTPLRKPISQHFPYLRVANVQRGSIDVAQLERYELSVGELEKWRLNKGDLLIVEGNGSEKEIGRCAIWQGEVDDCVFQNHLIRVRPNLAQEVDYLALYLNSPVGMAHMKRLAITTSGLFNLSVGKIRSIPVDLPPIEEQRRIVAKVDQLMTLCDQLKARISQAQQLHSDLAAALIAESLNEKTPANEHNASPKEARALLGAEILYALDGEQHTGRVKLQKVISLTEHAAKLKEIQSNEHRFAAGPHDPALMRELADELEARHWFAERRRDNGKRYEYQPLSKAGEHRRIYEKLWSDEQRRCVDAILNLVRSWDTARCERVSTLYSAWNDLLIEGKPCSDDNILREVTQRWHDSKRQYTDAVWRSELQSMKQHTVLLPSGFGRRTTGGTLTLPGFE